MSHATSKSNKKIEEQFIYQQAHNQGGEAALEKFSPPWKPSWKEFETIGHSSKMLGPSQKTLLVFQAGYGSVCQYLIYHVIM